MTPTLPFWAHFKVRPRMSTALVVGIAAGVLAPSNTLMTQVLIGWNAGVWAYLALMAWMMLRADHGHLRRTAISHAQGAAVVLGLVVAASVASVAAIVVELAWLRQGHGTPLAFAHVALTASTVIGAWLLLPVVFTLSYASLYYRQAPPAGLKFPDDDPKFQPHYSDFLYFAFTLAVAAQTSDVTVTCRPMRQLVLVQAVLSFAFNAAILALAINIAAGLLPLS
jgi:uncharacterized membrane protein